MVEPYSDDHFLRDEHDMDLMLIIETMSAHVCHNDRVQHLVEFGVDLMHLAAGVHAGPIVAVHLDQHKVIADKVNHFDSFYALTAN